MASLFAHVEQAPPDPILGLTQAFKDDTHEMKLNLGVGAYRTDEQEPYVLSVVKKTEAILLEKNLDKEYLPIDGFPKFVQAASVLVLGSEVLQFNKIVSQLFNLLEELVR
jgi:aspartate aminotransferase